MQNNVKKVNLQVDERRSADRLIYFFDETDDVCESDDFPVSAY